MKIATGTIKVNPDSPESTTLQLQEGEILLIGRKEDGGGVRKLVLPYPEISGKHAEIRCSEDGWTLVDLGSTNGTAVNGLRLHPGQHFTLRPGDRITLSGQYELVAEPPVDPGVPGIKNDIDRWQFKIKVIHATILVGDIKGFKSLMEQYANEANLVMKAAQFMKNELSKEIEEKHGHLYNFPGGAIIAYWHQEDESLQAVMACQTALRMKVLAHELAKNAENWPFPQNPFALDIAMATGPLGFMAFPHSKPALHGDTADLVFRLEKLIGDDRPGDIVVEPATYELTKEHFNFEPLGEFPVEGRRKPVTVYRLLSAKVPG
jgi:pSer/pThr/pTyr-binding forkhead associated (FHA) protein